MRWKDEYGEKMRIDGGDANAGVSKHKGIDDGFRIQRKKSRCKAVTRVMNMGYGRNSYMALAAKP